MWMNLIALKLSNKTAYEALGSVVHETELKALLIEKGFCQGPAQSVGRQSTLLAELQLREQLLWTDKHPMTA